MCGICGTFNYTSHNPIDTEALKRMVYVMRYRGPEEFGIYKDKNIGLGHARLSIIDLSGGQQPIHNEDKTIWIVYNGEVFNYLELREALIKKGHKFYTHSDTEVIVHLYEEKGADFVNDLNGQFAIAIWDEKKEQLLLARDRMGIRPLFYTIANGDLLFASEVKSIFTDNRVQRKLDAIGLDQYFTFWATLPPRTVFKGISELLPGHILIAGSGKITIKKYWQVDFSAADEASAQDEDDCAQRLLDLLKDAIRIRLRADVPVGAYLSGGLDSSLISALVKKYFNNKLQTFSVSFTDENYDEGPYQREMVNFLGTKHSTVSCGYADIGRIMPEVIWHAEQPLVRTAPAPLFLLSKLVRQSNFKVVLTGEGADEILAGYDLFREMKIRRFWAAHPDSQCRPLLLKKLYQYLPNWPRQASRFLEATYRANLTDNGETYYSHIPKWNVTAQVKSLFSEEFKTGLKDYNAIADFERGLPEDFGGWDHLSQAQYIEMQTLLAGNLLSSQGDRMMMANSVEGRFPFLDYRVVEFCAKIPPRLRLKVMNEKYILKKIAKEFLPPAITSRVKQGYRAPDCESFFNDSSGLEYVNDILSAENIKKSGYFDSTAVETLVKKCRSANKSLISAKHNMAIVGIITTQLLDRFFIRDFSARIEDNTDYRTEERKFKVIVRDQSSSV